MTIRKRVVEGHVQTLDQRHLIWRWFVQNGIGVK